MADLAAQMEEDLEAVPDDENLRTVANLAMQQVDLEQDITDMEDSLKILKEDHRRLTQNEIPNAVQELGLSSVHLANGTVIEIKPFIDAKIPKDRVGEAHTWLRANNNGDLIKHVVSANVGRDSEAAIAAVKALSKLGLDPEDKESVHHQTLKGFVREQVEKGTSIPLELFGVYIGQKSTIKKG
jgi:hypothetical protein|tara:strand:- start:630 stop:1181 length:552 start_codon:yes stop_codon:yes gene_type:complete